MKQMTILFATFLVILSTQVSGEIVKIDCGDKYLIDTNLKRMKYNCTDCGWMETVHWGEDYIVTINGKDNMILGTKFFQNVSTVLNRQTMVMMKTVITKEDFFYHDIDKEWEPRSGSYQCVRGF